MANRKPFTVGTKKTAMNTTNIGSNNADAMKMSEMTHYTENVASELVVEVDINLIDKDPENDKIYEMSDIESLAETLKLHGFEEPLTAYVNPDGTGRFLLSSGHRRYEAARLAGIEKVPLRKIPWIDEPEERVKKLIMHNRSRSKTVLEESNEINAYMQTLKGMSQADKYDLVGSLFGKSHSAVRRFVGIAEFIPELKEMVKNEEMYSVAGLCEAIGMSEDEQHQFCNKITEYVKKNGSIKKETLIALAKEVKNKDTSSKTKKAKATLSDDANKFLKKCKRQVKNPGEDTVTVIENAIAELSLLLDELKK